MKVAITGSSGFVGSSLAIYLSNLGIEVILLSRKTCVIHGITTIEINYADESKLQSLLSKIDVVVHLAGLAHQDKNEKQLEIYIAANVEVTKILALSSIKAKVKRFIFISSISVYGISGNNEKVLSELDKPNPNTTYGISKLLAEYEIKNIFEKTDTDFIILRPPLVYGANAPGNFKKLIKISKLSPILFFGSLNTKKSMIYIHNLTDIIFKMLELPQVANETFIVADKEIYSLSVIISIMQRKIFGKMALNLYIPMSIIKLIAIFMGKNSDWEKISNNNFIINNDKLLKYVEWQPPFSMEDALKQCVTMYKNDNV